MRSNDKYFSSVARMNKEWDDYKPERKMITIRNNSRAILFKYLQEITFDEPGLLLDDIDLFSVGGRQLRRAIKASNIDVKIKSRKCHPYCFCLDNYYEKPATDLKRLFIPNEMG